MQIFVATAVACADLPAALHISGNEKAWRSAQDPRSVSNQSSGLQNRLRTPIDGKYFWSDLDENFAWARG